MCAEIAQVIKAHPSTGPEQLNLENNQLILILSKNASGWWLGELQVSFLWVLKGVQIQQSFSRITVSIL